MSKESRHVKPENIDTFNAILKFHYYEANQTPETATIAFVALQEALKRESYSGIATAMLACMHCNQYLLDVSDAEYSHEQLSILSEKAFKLDPYSLTVRIIIAIKYFINNDKMIVGMIF